MTPVEVQQRISQETVDGLSSHVSTGQLTPTRNACSACPDEYSAPTRPTLTTNDTRERGEDHAIVGFETRTRDLALQRRELMAQHEDLDILRAITLTAQHEQVDHEANKTVETAHAPILAAPRTGPLTPTRKTCSTHPDEFSAPTA